MKWWRIVSRYNNRLEKRFDRIAKKASNRPKKQQKFLTKLLQIMQEDLAIVLLWVEKRYQGYQHLGKFKRETLRKNRDLLVADFKQFCRKYRVTNQFEEQLELLGGKLTEAEQKRLYYLYKIMAYLQPGDRYEYRAASSFDRLLVPPNRNETGNKGTQESQKMIGDCNQIVGLYAYLYSLKFPLADLQLTLLPGHVALHFAGIDIEATSATFHRYKKREVVPITELISITILDVPDKAQEQMVLTKKTLLEAAKVAAALSSKKELVAENLRRAYNNLALEKLTKNQFKEALQLAKEANKPELDAHILYQAVRFYGDKEQYLTARKYLKKLQSDKKPELQRWLTFKEVRSLVKSGHLRTALSKAQELKNDDLVKSVQAKMYNQLQKQTEQYTTFIQQKRNITTYKKMYKLAQDLDKKTLQSQLKKIIEQLKK